MSLINQMLKDLDKRRRGERAARDQVHHDPHPSSMNGYGTRQLRLSGLFKWIVFFIVVVWLGSMIWQYWHKLKEPGSQTMIQDTPAAEHVIQNLKALVKENNPKKTGSQRSTNTSLKPEEYQRLVALLNQIAPKNESESTQSVDEDATANLAMHPVVAQQLGELTKADNEEKMEPHSENSQMALQITHEAIEQDNSTSSKAEITKTRHASPMDAANESYRKALSMAERHDIKGAISILKSILEEHPEFESARETLAAIYIQKKHYTSANRLLDQGLSILPDHPPFITLKARILVARHLQSKALRLLESYSPSIKDYPDYYAFMAALYQNQGKFVISAKLYNELVRLQPSNGRWWLGMAIGLKAAGETSKALMAYKQARMASQLSPQLHAYVDQQINQLE